MKEVQMEMHELIGRDLGTCVRTFTMRDALLYNLTAGAPAEQLTLSYERDAAVLPTYACALGTWAVEACGDLGAYDRFKSLHANQQLEMRGALLPGDVDMTGRVEAVWDKGRAAVVVIAVEAAAFVARYTIFVPGAGGWGGERGPAAERPEPATPTWGDSFHVPENWAALYRLTGDEHPVHIDPALAATMGFARPILHGLCTLAIVSRAAAGAVGADPLDLTGLDLRFAQPVLPGQHLAMVGTRRDDSVDVTAVTTAGVVLGGTTTYRLSASDA